MKNFIFCFILCYAFMVGVAAAQEHWTEGPVWGCSSYRTKQGQFDNYMEYLRGNYLPQSEESKKEGLVLDTKVFTQDLPDAQSWDVMICTLFPSYGKALDYSKEDDDKQKAIAEKHFKTSDEDKQAQSTAKRFEMRDFVGTVYVREVKLRPMQ